MRKRARITAKGQITIPADLRKKARLAPGDEVELVFDGANIQVSRYVPFEPGRGQRLVEHLRKFRGHVDMTTDEIMALTRDRPMPKEAPLERDGIGSSRN